MTVLLVSTLVVAASAIGTGAALLRARRASLSAALLVVGGGVLAAGSLTLGPGPVVGDLLVTTAVTLLLPLAMVTYPSPRWRHPVAFLSLVVVGAGGALAVAARSDAWTSGMVLAIGTAALTQLWWRLETSDPQERRALLWAWGALGLSGFVVLLMVFAAVDTVLPSAALGLVALVGPALYVGVSSPDLLDVRGLVSATVVFLTSGLVVVAVFVLVMAGLEAAGLEEPSLGVTGAVAFGAALTLAPVRDQLRLVVDQLLFGLRPDPLAAASSLAARMGDDLLDSLAAVREGLVVPYVAHRAPDGTVTASGSPPPHTRRVRLGAEDEQLGELVVGLRPGDLGLGREEQLVLALVAPLLSQTLRARALGEELARARGRTVTALEDERRRLRRDLHDGLGPRLSGVAFTADAARRLLRSDPDAADALVYRLRADTTTAIEEIRGLVYGMRPPALDELGLIPALEQQAHGLRSPDGSTIAVAIEAPDELGSLSAAVEVAAYRIVVEALTNVARHSDADRVDVALRRTDATLEVGIRDNGSGAGAWIPGVGLGSMGERAAELGGSVTCGPGESGGEVLATLPLATS